MHEASFLSAVMGLIFVLGLILLLSWLLKRFGSPVLSGCLEQKKTQITLLEARQIDPKTDWSCFAVGAKNICWRRANRIC